MKLHFLKQFAAYNLFVLFLVPLSFEGKSQVLQGFGKRIEENVKRRVENKVDQTVDNGLNKAEEKINTNSKSKKKKNSGSENNTNTTTNNNTGTGNSEGHHNSQDSPSSNNKSNEFGYKSKFDFVPGERIIAFEDFSQDAIGDFPARWNTNSTGEIVNFDGRSGKWLMLNKEGVFLPEFINTLPENFTLEMDVACNNEFSFYSTGLGIAMANLKNSKEFTNWKIYSNEKTGTLVWIHPLDAGGSRGHSGFSKWVDKKEEMRNEAATALFHSRTGKISVHVSIWRQKQRLRVYLDAEKIWDVPRAFETGIVYNNLIFQLGGFNSESDRYLVSNIRLAVGAPDTRNKLITEGKFVTRGILFAVNSDQIKPESYGVIKDIASVLTENPELRVKIIGHTDADGDESTNLALSKRRAESVKNSLIKDFNINVSRLETDGKGEIQPTDNNTSSEGKANNRRVEFIKL